VPAWKDYQEDTAAYYRGLGLSADTDQLLEGARGAHKVDVVVRGYRAGVQFLWVVECKHWSRSIEKLHVAALVEIVEDLGADRGLILSKEGFQSGAIRLAKNRNISLTSLEDLRSDTADEYCEFQAGLLEKRCAAALSLIVRRTVRTRVSGGHGTTFKDPPGAKYNSTLIFGRIHMLKLAVDAARAGHWPVQVRVVGVQPRIKFPPGATKEQMLENYRAAVDNTPQETFYTKNIDELAAVVNDAMDAIEQELIM
jgi:hypothetical protein